MEKVMTIESSLSRIRYIGNGVTTNFSIPFPYLTNNDGSAQLAVYIGDSDTPLTEGKDYTIVGLGQAVAIDDDVEFATYEERFEGGDVVFEVAPEQGVPVAVVRNVPQTQGVVFVEGEKFPAQDFENALDKLTMEVQEIKENLQRAIVLSPTSTEKPIEARDAILLARDEAKTAAEQAQTAADNATSAVEEAEQQLADTKVYVDSAKADIDNTVVLAKADIESTKDSTIAVVTSTSASAVATIEQTVAGGKQEINTTIEDAQTSLSDTIEQAVEDVKAEATKAAEDAIQNAADEATQIATEQTIEYVENTAIPAISAVKDSAVSELESVLASDKSTLEGYVQVASDSVAISTQRASEAAESARVAGEKVNQIDGVVDDVNAAAASASASAIRSENSAVRAEEAEQRIMESGALPSQAGNDGKFLTTDGTNASWADVGGGLEIGDIGFAPLGVDESRNKRRYLNGQVISQAQFASFTNKIKAAIQLNPSIATSETNWQAEVTNSPYGICGKFVIDDTLGTIRLPKYPDWSIREVGQAAVVGNGMTLGLTDGTANYGLSTYNPQYGSALIGRANGYGTNVGSSTQQGGNYTIDHKSLGVTTDPTKSGVIADLVNANTEDKLQGKWFIQVATGTEESVDVTREIELNNPFSLLDYKWSEYEITNASWLISNGAFHSGATYVSVYELLLKIYNGTETKDGVSVKLSTEAYVDTDFVLNTADTTFRLPIKVKLASGNAVVGNGMALGFENPKGTAGLYNLGSNGNLIARTTAYGQATGIVGGTDLNSDSTIGITTDPTKSGIETSSSGLKLYFYVGETIQDANVIVASQVLTRVANSIDRTVVSDRETVVGWGMPDYSAQIAITNGYVAPSTGWIAVGATNYGVYVNINGINITGTLFTSYDRGGGGIFPVNKGDLVTFTNAQPSYAYFYPYIGAK